MSQRGGVLDILVEQLGPQILKGIARGAKRHVEQQLAPEVAYWRGLVGLGLPTHRHTSSHPCFF